MRISPLMNEPSDTPLWRRMIEIWQYNQDKLNSDKQELKSKFALNQILDPGELIHLSGIMLWMEKYGDLTISNGVDPVDFLKKYLEGLRTKGIYLEVNLRAFAVDRLSAHGYVVLGEDEFRPKILEIHEAIQTALNEATSLKYPEIYKIICENASSKDRDLDELLGEEFKPYLRFPVFKDANVSQFAELILRDKQIDAPLLKWMSERYRHFVTPAVRSEEQEWIDNLYAELRNKISSLSPCLNKWWLEILDQNLRSLLIYGPLRPPAL